MAPCEVAAVRFLVLVASKTVPNSDNPKMSIKSPVKCGVNSSTVERVGGPGGGQFTQNCQLVLTILQQDEGGGGQVKGNGKALT